MIHDGTIRVDQYYRVQCRREKVPWVIKQTGSQFAKNEKLITKNVVRLFLIYFCVCVRVSCIRTMPNSSTCDRCRLLLHQGKARERVALSHTPVALKVIFSDSDFCEKREFSQRLSRNSSPDSLECIKRFVALEASGSVRLLRQQQLICITCAPHVADKKFYGKTKDN